MKSKSCLITIVIFSSLALLNTLYLSGDENMPIAKKEDQVRQQINKDRIKRSMSRNPTTTRPQVVPQVAPSGKSNQNFKRSIDKSRVQNIQRQPRLIDTSKFKQRAIKQPTQQIQQQLNPRNDATRQRLQQFVKSSRAGQNIRREHQGHQRFGNIDQGTVNKVKTTLPHRIHDQNDTARRIRQHVGRHDHDRNRWFKRRFWNDHNYRPVYGNGNWWGSSSWPVVTNWLSWDTATPYYYDSGYPIVVDQETPYLQLDVNTYTSDNSVTHIYQEDDQEDQSSDWIPLGVFALVNDKTSISEANMFFQLVLGKDGTISGSYYNNSTDQVYPIEGIVDQDSQQAVWKMSVGEGTPIFQTGVYNLTRGYTEVQVNFNENLSQGWLMIRL